MLSDGMVLSLVTLLGLGVFHGINPAMGWLFAVALGLQERSDRAVWQALGPLAIGHVASVGAAIFVVIAFGSWIPVEKLQVPLATLLICFGLWRFFHHWHFRLGGMRVGNRDLAIWSFLMATAHGAGVMVLPIFLHMNSVETISTAHLSHAELNFGSELGLVATLAHGLGYLVSASLTGWIVYKKLGVGLLRKAWINLDYVWAAALVVTGVLTVLI